MAAVYCAIVDANNSDYWDGTIAWGYDATSDVHNPTAHANQAARDAQYTASYNTISAWETARDGVANADDDEYGIIQGPWDVDDTTACNINDWGITTGSITLRAIGDARHAGVWDDGADSPHRWVAANTSYITRIYEPNVTFDGLQIYNSESVDTSYSAIYAASDINLRVSNCIIKTYHSRGIRINGASVTAKIWNTIVYCEGDNGEGDEGIYLDSCDTGEVYNCTIYGFNDGIEVDEVATSVTLKNNIVFNNADDFDDAVGVTIDYNGSDDDTGTNSQTPSGADWANEMSNYAVFNFTLDSAGNMYDNGVTDPGTGLFDDDIKGTARTVSWSIGAFEYDVAPSGTILPQCTSYYNRIRSVSGD